MKASSRKITEGENLFIAAKVRPCSAEIESSLDIDSENSKITVKSKNKGFHFNNVFDENATQETIYDAIAQPIVDDFLGGINGTLFAYGQTGSGKTYTMNGNKINETSDSQTRGIIPRSIESIFEYLKARLKIDAQFEFLLKCSYIEVYKKVAYDLLRNDGAKVQILASGEQIDIVGAEKFVVTSVEECVCHLRNGWKNRKTAETSMNPESSRSHAIFMLTLVTKNVEGTFVNLRISRLNFVDLAGSENQIENTGDRLKEGACINQDLSHLANIIRDLGTAKKGAYIPYRDRLLTHLLRDSLGGNSRTSVIVTVHPNLEFVNDTVSTLNFAESCKKVKNQAKVNEAISTKDVEAWKAEKQKVQDENVILKEEKENLSKEIQQVKEQTEKRQKEYADTLLMLQNEKKTLKAEVEDATQKLKLMEFEKVENVIRDALKNEQKLKNEMSATIREYEALLGKAAAEQKKQINALEKSQKEASELQLAQIKEKYDLEIKKIMDDLKKSNNALQKLEDKLNEYKLLVAEKDKIIDKSKNELDAKILKYGTLLEKTCAEHKKQEKNQKETYELQLAEMKKEYDLKIKELSDDLKKANEKVEDKQIVDQIDLDPDFNASFGGPDYTIPETEGNQTIDLIKEKSPVSEEKMKESDQKDSSELSTDNGEESSTDENDVDESDEEEIGLSSESDSQTSLISHADGEETESNKSTPSTDEHAGNNETGLNEGTENNQPSATKFVEDTYNYLLHSNNKTKKKELVIFTSNERKKCYRYAFYSRFSYFQCHDCGKSTRILKDENETEYVKAHSHKEECKPFDYFESIQKKGFELCKLQNRKHDKLVIYGKTNDGYDKNQFYSFFYNYKNRYYVCSKCYNGFNKTVIAKIWYAENGREYVQMYNDHSCKPQRVNV
uniref:Kinesin-like protein n=1 Tax=Panagrolaimus davidi TaxID=227884 RepID=A0A914PQJ8_9BILA